MPDRPDASLIPLVRRLAELLDSDAGTQVMALMQKLVLLSASGASRTVTGEAAPVDRAVAPSAIPAADAVVPSPSAQPQRVGIWTRGADHAPWTRNPALKNQWRFWADIDEIPAKGARRRVLLLGESVARGYLFDPWLTPALVLERMLNDALGDGSFEVVDLARTDLTFRELVPLLLETPALEPDAIVLFAGNNWENVNLSMREFQLLATALRAGGFPACQRAFIDQVLVPASRAVLDLLAATVQTLGIPAVVVVPEVNLREWRNDAAALAPTLTGGGNRVWLGLWARAQAEFANERYEHAAALLREMIELDGGTGSPPQALLGECLLHLGRRSEARAALEAARDAVCGIFIRHAPLCPSAVQTVQRDKAAQHGLAMVDLSRVFTDHLHGELPDRRLFLDYCHLTREGIHLAMAATAAQLAPRLGRAVTPVGRFLRVDMPMSPSCLAMSHFLAAIHNAHYGQDKAVLEHHCREALASSADIAEVMRDYLDFQIRRAPNWMCRSYERIKDLGAAELRAVDRYLSPEDAGTVDKFADFALVDCIERALRDAGVEVEPWLSEHIRREHVGDDVNLLATRYRAATFWERSGHSTALPRAYHQACTPVSTFFLIRDDSAAVTLRLTCRVRGSEPVPDHSIVRVNGVDVARVPAHATWGTHAIAVPRGCLRAGVNRIDIHWPIHTPPCPDDLERAASNLERCVFPDVLPVFGEIFMARSAP
ncbi:MAG: hypothetical protein L0211_05350 [Planctomycetaceae bacterium]|nr:hypothetical protein [Planctomycetaceae bacterium]